MNSINKNSVDQVIIVIPCFNEADNLLKTCLSFGFGSSVDVSPESTTLILVNNNSTDTTNIVCEVIKSQSPRGKVIIRNEAEQGYVPARHSGIIAAKELAAHMGWDMGKILVLQADADTQYSQEYIFDMRSAAERNYPNKMFEGNVDYDSHFKSENQRYMLLKKVIDEKVKDIMSNIEDDVIVDDKVAGYRLSDYFEWGGHRREYTEQGDEIFAGTSRLFIAAKGMGAQRIFVDTAPAIHSHRKLVQEAALHFATAGYTREKSYKFEFLRTIPGVQNLTFDDLNKQSKKSLIDRLTCIRIAHLIALFCILPAHVKNSFGNHILLPKPIMERLPLRQISDLSSPGIFINDILIFISDQRNIDILLENFEYLLKE